jgi:hypothetical protein
MCEKNCSDLHFYRFAGFRWLVYSSLLVLSVLTAVLMYTRHIRGTKPPAVNMQGKVRNLNPAAMLTAYISLIAETQCALTWHLLQLLHVTYRTFKAVGRELAC